MTQIELATELLKTNFPVAYLSFKKPPTLPFIVYINSSREGISADDKVWHKLNNYRIELYTNKKDPASELILENVLDNAGIFYEMDEAYIDSEAMHESIYTIQI